jgi:hypothetical protein
MKFYLLNYILNWFIWVNIVNLVQNFCVKYVKNLIFFISDLISYIAGK